MNRFTIIIDYFNGNLYYRKNQNFSNEFEYNMSGIDVKAIGKKLDRYVVTQLREHSPATSVDIQLGDEIIAINGSLTKDMTLGELNNYFRLKEGKKLRMEFRRNKEKIKRKIYLERVI